MSTSKEISGDDEDDNGSTCSNNEVYSSVFQQESFTSESKYLNGNLKFFPPVYIQRYEAVFLILKEPPWRDTIRKVVDFGCAELDFFLYLKHVPGIEEILEVDIDENILIRYVTKAEPLAADYFYYKRSKPLDVYLFAGSIAEYDDHLQGTDVVIAIEVIEHLNQDVLDKIPHNIFHDIRPKLAIFTTPNADFNVLFPRKETFRHPDHKFEWSRKEFYKWTQKITKKYPNYSVKFYGIGVGPQGSENLGCCTQMAVFEKTEQLPDESCKPKIKRGINNYKLIRKINYPFYVDTRTNELKIFHEVSYRMKFTFKIDKYFNFEEEMFEVPLTECLPFVNEWCESEENLKKVLLDHELYVIEKNGINYLTYNGDLSESVGTQENESVEINATDVEYNDFVSENWDWDCGDGSFNCPLSEKEEELPNFLSARSLQEITGLENTNMNPSRYPEVIGDADMKYLLDSSTNLGLHIGDCVVAANKGTEIKSKSITLSKIPRRNDNASKNMSKSAKTLKSWIHARIGF